MQNCQAANISYRCSRRGSQRGVGWGRRQGWEGRALCWWAEARELQGETVGCEAEESKGGLITSLKHELLYLKVLLGVLISS